MSNDTTRYELAAIAGELLRRYVNEEPGPKAARLVATAVKVMKQLQSRESGDRKVTGAEPCEPLSVLFERWQAEREAFTRQSKHMQGLATILDVYLRTVTHGLDKELQRAMLKELDV